MKKTLLSALKHGSGILLTLFALLLSCQVWAGDVLKGVTFYFKPNANWRGADAQFCLYYFISDDDQDGKRGFVPMAKLDPSYDIYYATVPDNLNYDRIKFVRMNPSGSSCSWNSKWNETTNKEYSDGKDYYIMKEGVWDEGDVGTWFKLRSYSTDEYFYFVNGTDNKDKDGNNIGALWINTNGSSEIGYAEVVLTDIFETTYTYDFSLYSGEAYASGAVYRAKISTGIMCKSFKLTRGNGKGGKSQWNETGQMTFEDDNITYNTITKITGSSGTSWTGSNTTYCNNPTVTAGAYSSLTSSSVTIAATVTAAESDPCELSKVGVDVYTDQACTVSASVNKEVSYVGSDYSITEVNVSSLSPKVTYYYKTYAKRSSDNAKVYSSNVVSFTMPCQSGVETTDPSAAGEGPKCFGDTFTPLSVTASGASGYTYQWYYNTTNSTTEGSIAISGATSASYTPAVVGENYYYCAVGATGGYCEENSHYSGKVIINATPTLSVSESSVTNYAPVTVTAKGADIATWSVDTPANNSDRYLYKKTASSAKFKAKVNASATYTITGTTANSCSNTATVTVTTDSQDCH